MSKIAGRVKYTKNTDKPKRKSVAQTTVHELSTMSKGFIDALCRGGAASITPKALVIRRTGPHRFKLSIVGEGDEELVTVVDATIDIGCRVTVCDLHKAFEITFRPA